MAEDLAKQIVFYFFALTYHVLGFIIWVGLMIERFDSESAWEDGCFRGSMTCTKTSKEMWGNQCESPPPCNEPATVELVIMMAAGGIFAVETVVTILARIVMSCQKKTVEDFGLFKTWEEDDSILKMFRAASILSAYVLAFTWACGFTASFHAPTEPDNENALFRNSGYLIAFFISILVTILPRQRNGGYGRIF